MPRSYMDGGLIIGDSASLLNSQRLKGIHTAIKSGMLAAETIYDALCSGDTSAKSLSAYQTKLENSWIKKELWEVRNFHQAFHGGLWTGLAKSGIQFITGGRGLVDPMRTEAGYKEYEKLNRDRTLVDQSTRFQRRWQAHLRPSHRRISFRNTPRRRSALPPDHSRAEYLRRPLRPRIRQPLPIFLSCRRLRNGDGQRRAQIENQRRKLRPLQNLRHRRPLPNHQLGPARRRRRPELRRHVIRSMVCSSSFWFTSKLIQSPTRRATTFFALITCKIICGFRRCQRRCFSTRPKTRASFSLAGSPAPVAAAEPRGFALALDACRPQTPAPQRGP